MPQCHLKFTRVRVTSLSELVHPPPSLGGGLYVNILQHPVMASGVSDILSSI